MQLTDRLEAADSKAENRRVAARLFFSYYSID